MTIDQNKAFDLLCELAKELQTTEYTYTDLNGDYDEYKKALVRFRKMHNICTLQPDEDKIILNILKG